MKIGVPTEIKNHEYRIGLVPSSVVELTNRQHEIFVQAGAGLGIGVSDEEFVRAGAHIVATAEEVFANSDLIVKVKEPQPEECRRLQPHQTLFTFLHLAIDKQQASLLQDSGATAIAYETVTDHNNRLPLLAPMSEVAGRISIQVGAACLEKNNGGKGVLLGGVPGVAPARVVVVGGGVVGTNAIQMAIGQGAEVTVIDRSLPRLRELHAQFGTKLRTIHGNLDSMARYVAAADLVVGAVLVPGAAAPKLVSREMIAAMQPGSVVIDVAIDQGGCFATSRPTNFEQPTYVEEGVIHQCVTNLPGSVPRTSAFALNNATLPFIIELAEKGYRKACIDDNNLCNGLNVCAGKITHQAVADALGESYTPARQALQD